MVPSEFCVVCRNHKTHAFVFDCDDEVFVKVVTTLMPREIVISWKT